MEKKSTYTNYGIRSVYCVSYVLSTHQADFVFFYLTRTKQNELIFCQKMDY